MSKYKKGDAFFLKIIPKTLQIILNISLVFLAVILSYLLMKELFVFGHTLIINESHDYQLYLANILIYFLYFEFIAMIIKYFKEDYHFPLRYFLYIGITAMVRLIIVDHGNPVNTLFYSLVILILIIGYFIMNITPRERPDGKGLFKKQ
ncbi:phosphate-starvation-inducible protein PsiE [Sporosarcina sp. ANT_H38]|uniref:phosphate-starvation-inducible protein PsiE n=1 Tax=Sporosarcina sp. ANT_H38 TaxID=2597358 RepID=UPI00165E4670|nr:phosphate-starvation-inducible protein PsiE [Sporosarcina sp. ANT_H38]